MVIRMRRKQSIIKWTGMCLAITMLAGCGSRGDTNQAIAEAETQTQQATVNITNLINNISSELSKKGRECYGHYAASKGGINSLTMCMALELAPEINVNIVAPGPIETDMILADMEPEWVEKEKDIPLKRLGKVEEIAAAALLLASDDGNFFCGQFVSPNGGAVFF